MSHGVDLDGRNGGAAEARQDDTAQAVAKRHTIAGVKRLNGKGSLVALFVSGLEFWELNCV